MPEAVSRMARTMRIQWLVLPVVALGAAACTWIPLTDAGAAVSQATPAEVTGCRLVGNVSASTQDRVLIKRSRGKVAEELTVLARNEAATLGGDTVVPAGPIRDGRQDFDVYRCDAGDS